jgi:hypothetical protein
MGRLVQFASRFGMGLISMIVTSISVLLFLPRELIRSPEHNAIFKRSTAGTSGGPVSLFPRGSQNRFTAERVLRTRPKTYRAIVQLLSEPDAKVLQIAKLHRVSEHTVVQSESENLWQ